MDCNMPGFPVLHCLLELAQTHVHWVADSIQPSSVVPFSSCLLSFLASGFFSNESALCIRWPKYWSISFSTHQYSGLIFFRIDWFGLLEVQRASQESSPAPQFESICSSALSLHYGSTLSSYMTTGKTIALTVWTFVAKVMSLLLNILSRCVIAFFLKSKSLLISWLQSLSTVILEPKKIKCVTVPNYSPWSDVTRCHDLSFLNAVL